MASERYNFSLTTFSPSGKLGQIEHALTAVSKGATSVGIKGTNGVVICTEKKSTPLANDAMLESVAPICKNVGVVYSGLGPDSRVLVDKARKSAQKYKLIFGKEPSAGVLVRDIATIMQEFTQRGGVRPFGVSLLVAGFDEVDGPSLYQVDPSGSYFAWKATAIGKNMVNAKTFLEKRYSEEFELEDAVHTAILTLKEGFEGELSEDTIEVGILGVFGVTLSGKKPEMTFRKLGKSEVRDYLANIA